MARIERATSPLPRECSTTELHGRLVTDTMPKQNVFEIVERVKGIEPSS